MQRTTPNNKPIINSTLIIIPDIIGFTEYMSNSNFKHSQIAIGSLLESILDNNILNLKVSEIGGNTVLFYSYDYKKTVEQIINQCEIMFQKFHDKLKTFNSENCGCGSCEKLHGLKLKFVVHFGDLNYEMLEDYCSLSGKDLIIAKRLLKHELNIQESILVTDEVLINFKREKNISMINSDWKEDKESITDIGTIKFMYKKLEIS